MLYFREGEWSLIHGSSRFSAYVPPSCRTPDDVHWSLEIEYVASGQRWRRVRPWQRPSVSVSLSGFTVGQTWRDLERLNFWSEADDVVEAGGLRAGILDTSVRGLDDLDEDATFSDCGPVWRVAAREGRFFIVELALLADPEQAWQEVQDLPVMVLPDGHEAQAEPDRDFWRAHSSLYVVEHVPFGTVTVRVPRNARDPQANAVARAATLLGAHEPHHIRLTDFTTYENSTESLHNDLYVELHYHGHYED